MHLLQLPTELHLQVSDGLSESSCARLCSVRQRLHSIYTKPLYLRGHLEALLWSAQFDVHETLHLALQYGTKIDDSNKDGRKAFLTAACHGKLRTLMLLHDKGADVHSKDRNGLSAMYLAATMGHAAVLKFLLQLGVHGSAMNSYGMTALYAAARQPHVEVVKALLEHGSNVGLDQANYPGGTPVYIACRPGHLSIVRMLVEYEADITEATNYTPNYRRIPFHAAVFSDELDIVKWFVERNLRLDLECRYSNGRTPLWT